LGARQGLEQDRWFFWLPVLFAGGVLTYFAPIDEPQTGLRLVIGALGLCLAARHAPLGLCLGGAALPFASSFATAKLPRRDGARARAHPQAALCWLDRIFVETYELRDNGLARLTLRVLSLGDLRSDQRPYHVRVSLPASDAATAGVGEAIAMQATSAAARAISRPAASISVAEPGSPGWAPPAMPPANGRTDYEEWENLGRGSSAEPED
jgi:hypothetical protein